MRFDHDHFFDAVGTGTLIREEFDFEVTLGPFGRLCVVLFLERYMRRFLVERTQMFVVIAEFNR